MRWVEFGGGIGLGITEFSGWWQLWSNLQAGLSSAVWFVRDYLVMDFLKIMMLW